MATCWLRLLLCYAYEFLRSTTTAQQKPRTSSTAAHQKLCTLPLSNKIIVRDRLRVERGLPPRRPGGQRTDVRLCAN
jgi:hypothetical protein